MSIANTIAAKISSGNIVFIFFSFVS